MIATVAFSAHVCGDTAWKGEDVTISIKDSSNEVIASAVYDFASDPMQFTSGTATLELAYAIGQYWRASDQIETKSTSMVVQKGATPNGNAVASVGDARGGANIADSDAERYAQLALSWQLSHDRSAVSGLYDIPTTQLFSRKYGMEVDGKTQQYRDIYAQYLTLRASWPRRCWRGPRTTATTRGMGMRPIITCFFPGRSSVRWLMRVHGVRTMDSGRMIAWPCK